MVLTDLVLLYQICFKQVWKAMKKCLENDGMNRNLLPRSIVKYAYKFNMIENQEAWLNTLKSRNKASYIYIKTTHCTGGFNVLYKGITILIVL